MIALDELNAFLDDLVVPLNFEWRLYQELFQVPDHQSLFMESGVGVWEILGNALIDSVFMGASRLFDRAASCGRENLSFAQIIQQMPDSEAKTATAEKHRQLKENYNAALKQWRNRKLSHNDLETISGVASIPDISYIEIDALIKDINQLARSLGLQIREIDQSYVPFVANRDWVWKLITVLKRGTEAASKEEGAKK